VVLRAVEVEAEAILLAKAVDGVYDSDPVKNPDAKRYDVISIEEVVEKKLQVVDMAASILAMENHMPMYIFSLNEKDSIVNTVNGKFNGTRVTV
jgi:uridylate kinase